MFAISQAHICHPAYSQCRVQIDGAWSDKPSWQCQKPGDTPSSVDSSELISNTSSLSSGLSNLGESSDLGDGISGGLSPSKPVASSSSSLSVVSQNNTPNSASTPAPQMGSMSTASDTTLEMYANASASLGGCIGLAVPAGWDGVASTSVRMLFVRDILLWKADIAISITDTWERPAIVGKMVSVKHHGKLYVRFDCLFALLVLSRSLY